MLVFHVTSSLGEVFCGKVAMILKEEMTIVSQREIATDIFEMVLTGQLVEQMSVGQFLHIRVPDISKVLRRPISICQIDKAKREATIVYRVQGLGTEIFSHLGTGDVLDCMGPQGNGFPIDFLDAGQTALLVGGGIGVPPLLELAKQLYAKGVSVTAVIGFASKDVVILEQELAQFADVIVTTDDGSYGTKGYVSTVIDTFKNESDAVYACGAPGMLNYVDQKFEKHPHAYLSMESRMACGMGACYACVVHVKDADESKSLRVCEDGPVFATGTVLQEMRKG